MTELDPTALQAAIDAFAADYHMRGLVIAEQPRIEAAIRAYLSATPPQDGPSGESVWPDVHAYVENYEWRGDGDYTPNESECALLEDAINGYAAEAEAANRLSRPAPAEGVKVGNVGEEDFAIQPLVADLVRECERAMRQRDASLDDPSKRGSDGRTHDTMFERIVRDWLTKGVSALTNPPGHSAAPSETVREVLCVHWNPRGIGSNFDIPDLVTGVKMGHRPDMSGFVGSKAEGHLAVAIFGGNAYLDYREREPEWIQVKVSADEPILAKLEHLVRQNGNLLTPAIVAQAIGALTKDTTNAG